MALDSAGILYIADTGNNVVRKVSGGTQVITTIAGNGTAFAGDNGAATAQLNGPLAVALDSSGNLLYIADTGNNVIRKIVLSTGVITTVAGTRNPRLTAAMAGRRRRGAESSRGPWRWTPPGTSTSPTGPTS